MIDARHCPKSRGKGLIIAAPASGSGKTLITAGLLRYFCRAGVDVAAAKAGPDFIDPTLHHAASGRACLNLDVWAMRRATLAGLVAELGATADLVLCEGVMGLFDGTGADGEAGSTAELARLTGWPVVLVVDARGQGASVAALLRGFTGHDPGVRPLGVIFNRVSSARHRELLAQAVARHLPDLACLGALPADPALRLPARHLGLVPAGELAETDAVIDRAATLIGGALDVARLAQLARASLLGGSPRHRGIPPLGRRIAVARDEAFRFTYPACSRDGVERAPNSPSSHRWRTNRPTRSRIRSISQAAIRSSGRAASPRRQPLPQACTAPRQPMAKKKQIGSSRQPTCTLPRRKPRSTSRQHERRRYGSRLPPRIKSVG
jgi:cobyrinic acid a,c-diamide synthase